ncbi:SDR family NAD(P)-dependent oxidoreductase [Burkholderia sola]|uniref:SDR family NAD(P)-dependent oxidoreductase n=1 Tax=Burkholderia sola TaxID=2843302 RepID=UPI003390037D
MVETNRDFQNPAVSAVLVTGGSRGLGLSIVRDLLARGVKVATFSRTISHDLNQLHEQYGDALFSAALDLNDQQDTLAFMDSAASRFGFLDGLVNNAAVGQDSLLIHTSPEKIQEVIQVDLIIPILITRLFARRILRDKLQGRIVSISSILAHRAFPAAVAYSAAKAGLEAATLALAQECRGRILANCVAPGFFDSAMSSIFGPKQRVAIKRRIVTGRTISSANIVPIVRMLLMEDTGMNGQTIIVDGGARS